MAMRFSLAQDNDCHWYVIPADKQSAWEKWLDDQSQDDELDVPEYATEVGGHYSLVTFTDPQGM